MSKSLDRATFDYGEVTKWSRLGFTSPARIARKMGYNPQQFWDNRHKYEEFKDRFDDAVMEGHVDAEEDILSKMWQAADEGESWAIKELAKRLAPMPKGDPTATIKAPVTLELTMSADYLRGKRQEALADKGIVVETVDESDD